MDLSFTSQSPQDYEFLAWSEATLGPTLDLGVGS